MLKELLWVGAGGFIGSVARYLVAVAMRGVGGTFPWATLTVNLLGCLLIGFVSGLASRHAALPAHAVLFLTVGICGGFTTFSTFSKEGLMLIETGQWWPFLGYTLASVTLGIAAVAAGLWLAK